ncbi:MAG: MFS transporter [Desulfarculaceae bacterium]|jgi:MFS family permease
MTKPSKLFGFEYVSLLGIILLVFCNIAVFYNLFNHLANLGIPGDLRGFLIGVYSLTAIPLYLFASPFVNHHNAPKLMLLGILTMAACGVAYLFAASFWALLILRIINGAGMFCLSASSLALLVRVIPADRSGQGFAIYSAAILIPYALVPTVVDALSPWLPTFAHAYAGMAVLLVPAAAVVLVLMRGRWAGRSKEHKPRLLSWAEIRQNVSRMPVAVMLGAQCVNFLNFSGLFFLFKEFAGQIGLHNVGYFFAVQMLLMLAIRTFGSRIFDRYSKVLLLKLAFLFAAGGFLALAFTTTTAPVIPIALLFGMGASLGYPALNSLMFLYSEPHLRSLNANLMMLALQVGYFFGPLTGGFLVVHMGFQGFFLAWMGLNLAAFGASTLLLHNPAPQEQAGS